ncbi:MAG: putative endonuclease [Ilumatobacteraceae bacterium]|nr:putative endonuclease [Ilumatobacteraceae bacterium]
MGCVSPSRSNKCTIWVVDMPAIDSLDELIDAVAFAARHRAHVALAAAKVAVGGVWTADGASSISVWLQAHCQLSSADAHALLSEGRFLTRYSAVADAALTGRLSGSQVTVIRRSVPPALAELFDDHQQTVVDAVAELNVVDTAIVCQQWRVCGEATLDTSPDAFHERSRKSSKLDDGSIVGQFVFDPTSADTLNQALDTARTRDDNDTETRTPAQTLADAIVTIAAFFNANHTSDITPRHRRHADVNIDIHQVLHPDCDPATCPGHDSDPSKLFEAAFGSGACVTTADGVLLPDWAADAYLCDCVMHRVIRSASAVLDYGVAVRTPPQDLFRAIAARDRGCRFPDCHRTVPFTHAHHIIYAENLGPTALKNLLLLCSYHHHLIHRQRWKITLDPNADAHFTHPDGRVLTTKPHSKPTFRIPTAA